MPNLALLLLLSVFPVSAAYPSQQVEKATSQKSIKDPGEFNAYIAALNTKDPAQKAAAMEAFINQYPNSIVKIDALEQAMQAYQQANNQDKVLQTANVILQINPEHIRALAIVTYVKRFQASGGDAGAVADLRVKTELGLKLLPNWPKPEGVSDAEFKSLRDQMAWIFYGAAGFVALQAKDFSHARESYLKSVEIAPDSLQDIYQLAIAELSLKPIDVNGLWYIARAINLAKDNKPAQQSMINYGKAMYHRYHGSDDGWEQLITSIANAAGPPADFARSVKPAPTAAEIAVKAVQENDPDTLSFSDWEFILTQRDASPANGQAADRVWRTIQAKQGNGDKKLLIPIKVVSVAGDTILAAITDENQQANKADLRITLEKAMPQPPAIGSMVKVVGVLISYTPTPFIFEMKGIIQ